MLITFDRPENMASQKLATGTAFPTLALLTIKESE